MKKLELERTSLFTEIIPEELKELDQWVVYRLEYQPDKEKPTKPLFQANGERASSTDPETWCTFKEVCGAYETGSFEGIGFVFTKNDPYCGIDLDNCKNLETDIIETWAKDWVDKLQSYTEYSPSNTGIHIIVKGNLPSETGKKKGDYEMYDHSRYFTFTGNLVDVELACIEERQGEIEELHKFLDNLSRSNNTEASFLEGHKLSAEDIQEIISKARASDNGEKFSALFEEGWEGLGYSSQSEADQALCNYLSYWTDGNSIGIDQIFRQSKLYRKKWERKDYREGTIKKSLDQRFNQHNNEEVKGIPIIRLSDVKFVPVEYQVDKIWPINSVGIMSGQPGVYKTWLAWEIAVSIASGTKLFNLHECKKGKVLIFNAEDSLPDTTRTRIEAIASHKKVKLADLELNHLNIISITLNEKKFQEDFEITVSKYKPNFIILDPLINMHSLDEDNATEMSKLLKFLRKINKEYSCSILLVCHNKKSSNANGNDLGAQVRGSSVIVGWRDVALFLKKKKDKIIEVTTYNRSISSLAPFFFELKIENNREGNLSKAYLKVTTPDQIVDEKRQEILKSIKSIISEDGPISGNKIQKKLEMNRPKCLELVNDLLKSEEIKNTKKGLVIND